jgi:DNA-binding MarR family transcriptional regulator
LDSTDHQRLEETKRLLALAPFIRRACDLDLLVFLYRHPRTLLTNEQLAAFVGYDMKQVAQAIDAFIDAGLLERIQNSMHAARMYLLALNGPQGGGLTRLVELASTREGRREILQLLGPERSQTAVDITQAKRRLHAIA